ncbi:MAG: filamentous hemagglutinin N-terminal domain-containing protein [Nostoc sp. ChiSLP01]|nr:filamentous hemagglutinin N-terminal domain-containing protein [Nostoc sp. CmiSLP01]MDZ8282541.1 filamentous hemagglutinin N-terminal domain-containing protein [Nostoc sp. ChiSLP01]
MSTNCNSVTATYFEGVMSGVSMGENWFLKLGMVAGSVRHLDWLLTLGIAIAFHPNIAIGQITPDTTLPNNSNVNTLNNITNITGGTQVGSNLFHSFSEFSILKDTTAYFNNAPDIQNIISRVTGSSQSKIDGILRTNATANLFFINPNGIIFGENARLDIGGSFIASTASSIKFANDLEFSATTPESTPLLTINTPIGLQYKVNPGTIEVKGDGQGLRVTGELIDTTNALRVPANQTLALVGGDISLEGATLKTAGGRIELGSVGDNSLVTLTPITKGFALSYDGVQNFGNIQLSKLSAVDASGAGSGDIQIQGRRVTIADGSQIEASTLLGEKAGNLVVNATELVELISTSADGYFSSGLLASAYSTGDAGDLTINTRNLVVRDGAQVSTATFGTGKGASLTVNAQDIQLIGTTADGLFPSGLFASTQSTGNGGDLTINTQNLLARDGAQVAAYTSDAGKAGSLTVNAKDVQMIGTANSQFPSGLFNYAYSTGNAGDLTINTQNLLVRDGANVATQTYSAGKTGSITVNAEDIQLIGRSANGEFASDLSVDAGLGSTGDAGNLTINTQRLLVRDGAYVDASIYGTGKGGALTVTANDIQLIGTSTDDRFRSGLFTQAYSGITGDAGDLTINTQNLLVLDGAQIDAETYGTGKGGFLNVTAKDIQLIGSSSDGRFPSGLLTSTYSTGDAGNLKIDTQQLLVRDGALINTSTSGTGKGGSLTVTANDVQLIGESSDGYLKSRLFTTAAIGITGDAGDLTINTQHLLVRDGAFVDASTEGTGKAGSLTVNAKDVQLIGVSSDGRSGSGLNTSAKLGSTGDAGDLTINTQQLLVRDGAQIGAATSGAGKGGSLTLNAKDVQLIGTTADSKFPSGFFTTAYIGATGDAGNLTINTQQLLVRDGAKISAGTQSAGKGGSLTLNAKDVQLIGRSADGSFSSGLFASTDSTGDAGDLKISSEKLLVQDGAIITVSSLDKGIAGNLNINADFIRLNNNASVDANTQAVNTDPSKEQATITVRSQDLLLLRNSNITTNASGENVIGGNININTDVLVAFDNSDISANSTDFRGGQVTINAKGVLGTQFRDVPTPNSDITATGANQQLNGTVQLNTPQQDPTNGLEELPLEVVDASQLINQNFCAKRGNSSFTLVGRGGLPPSPNTVLNNNTVWEDWRVTAVPRQAGEYSSRGRGNIEKSSALSTQIVEAQGWVVNAKGEVILTAAAPTPTPHSLRNLPFGCYPEDVSNL